MKNEKKHGGTCVYKASDYSVIDCEYCGYKHIYPIPDQIETEQLYEEEYYEKAKPAYIKHVEEDQEWLDKVYDERIKVMESYFKDGIKIRTLDIGSGPGSYLKAASKKGWEATGIEPSKLAAEYSNSMDLYVINTFFSKDLAKQLPKYHVIHINNVLEHVANPEEFIELAWTKLEDCGVLCVEVPNDFNSFQQILHSMYDFMPWWVNPKEHLNYFDFGSMRKLLENHGFSILKETTNFPMELFLMMDENYVGNEILGRQCHNKRKKLELKLFADEKTEVKSRFYDSLASAGLGREVIMYAQKKIGMV